MDVQPILNANRILIDQTLDQLLPAADEVPTALVAAMRHAMAGGKRIRPFLTRLAAAAFGLSPDTVLPTACGLEMMHCATLVHDDLPSIDNADLRHGHTSCHLAFNEATAVLAADALIIMAFEWLARQASEPPIPPALALQCVRELAEFTGSRGLIVGEAMDIETERHPFTEADLEFIHLNKTAKLIVFAARAGAILAGAPSNDLQHLTDYARALGLLFQITDDLLDVTGDQATVGKPVGADAAAGKATYPALLGLAEARRRAGDLAAQAAVSARLLPQAETWLGLLDFIVSRRK